MSKTDQMALFQDSLSENEKETINRAMYYAVRENLNQKLDLSKNDLFKEALDIFKGKKKMPITSGMAKIAVDDFFTSCIKRGWEDELYKISWLKVGKE